MATAANFSMSRGNTQAFLGFAKYRGMGLTSVPTVVVTGDGTGATATAIVAGGVVTGFSMTSGGTGYTMATVTVGGGYINVQADATISGTAVSAITVRPVNLSPSGTEIIVLYKLTNCATDTDDEAVITFKLSQNTVTLPNGGTDGVFRWELQYADTAPESNDHITDNGQDVTLNWTARGILPNMPTNKVYDFGGGTLLLQQGDVRTAA